MRRRSPPHLEQVVNVPRPRPREREDPAARAKAEPEPPWRRRKRRTKIWPRSQRPYAAFEWPSRVELADAARGSPAGDGVSDGVDRDSRRVRQRRQQIDPAERANESAIVTGEKTRVERLARRFEQ